LLHSAILASVKALKRAGNRPIKAWFKRASALFFDPDALLLTGLRNFSTANDNGGGNAATHLVATRWHTWSHSTCNTTATQNHSRFIAANIGKSR